jgi:hypothetical protein
MTKRIIRNGGKTKRQRPRSKITFHKLDWLEWLTIGFAGWFLFFVNADTYRWLLGILLAIPILGLLLNGLHKPSIATLVDIDLDDDGNPKYDVADFIDVAALVILIRVLKDYEFESIYSLIIPGTIAFCTILVILFLTHSLIEKSNRDKTWLYLSVIFNISLYSYAGTYAANCAYDYSEPTVYKTEVLDKQTSRGRKGGTTYYLEVAPWGHHHDKEKIKVSKVDYDIYQIGDTVEIDLKEGLFDIPWYYVH